MSSARGSRIDPASLVRPLVRRLHAYVPGEQPRDKRLIKLNTNENPYPPSPRVLKAVRKAVDGRLRLYPNPTAEPLRIKLAQLHRCDPENIVVGNGSDELLALATRAFVEPHPRRNRSLSGKARSRHTVQYLTPSYSLYPVLASIVGARQNAVELPEDFRLPSLRSLESERCWDFQAALSFVTTPNAPSGRAYPARQLDQLCRRQRGVVVLDEAYVDFAEESALSLALKYSHVLVSRTFSKAYSLCSLRIGYFVGHPELVAALNRIRDSYNVNGLGQVAATAALEDPTYYRTNFKRIVALRSRVGDALTKLGCKVLPSQTNFLLVRPPGPPAQTWLERLRKRGIIVRWFSIPRVRSFLRITIGTEREMNALLSSMRFIRDRL